MRVPSIYFFDWVLDFPSRWVLLEDIWDSALQHLHGAPLESCLKTAWEQFTVWVSLVRRAGRKGNRHWAEWVIKVGIRKERWTWQTKKELLLKEGSRRSGWWCSFCQGCWMATGFPGAAFAYGRIILTRVISDIPNRAAYRGAPHGSGKASLRAC